MPRRTLLITAIAATAAANSPLHLSQSEDLSSIPPRSRRTRRRTEYKNTRQPPRQHRLLNSELTRTTNSTSVSNDFALSLPAISALLPPTAAVLNGSSAISELELGARIINGDAATPNRYPYTASLVSSGRHVCGGTLIAPDVILTAGHCSGFFDQVQIDRYDITTDDGGYDFLLVEEHYAHPNYGNVIQSDFALAKLFGRSFKSPVTLNTGEDLPVDDEYLTVMGWGVTVEGVESSQSDLLRQVDVQYMTNGECDASSGNYEGDFVTYDGYIEDNMLCAWSDNQDACQGDSGGPLIIKGDDADEDVQVGVVSWGLGCAMDTFPGVYSRISAEYEWIRSSVCKISKYPPSSFGCGSGEDPSGEMATITVAIELDGMAEETSWVLEADDRGDFIDGTSYAPFGTYDSDNTLAVETLEVVPNQLYRFTVMDRSGGGSARSTSKYRICYGSVSGSKCLADDGDLIICGGTGLSTSSRSVTCLVEAPTQAPAEQVTSRPIPVPVLGGGLPTFSPFFVPLFFETRQPEVARSEVSTPPTPSPQTSLTTSSSPPDSDTTVLTKGNDASPTKSPVPTTNSPKNIDLEESDSSDQESTTVANAQSAASSAPGRCSFLRQLLFAMAALIFFV